MSAQDRLAAAIHNGREEVKFHEATYTQDARDDARGATRADTHLAQDIADGQALRMLREALPDANHFVTVESPLDVFGWIVSVDTIYHELSVVRAEADTIAEAADACRAEVEARS